MPSAWTVVLLLFLAAAAVYMHSEVPQEQPLQVAEAPRIATPTSATVLPVATRQWSKEDGLAPLREAAAPLVLQNTPATQWKATRAWSADYLCNKVRRFHDVRVSSSPVFAYFNRKRAMAEQVQWHTPFRLQTMSCKQFFRLRNDSSPDASSVYYSVPIDEWMQGKLAGDVEPRTPLLMPPGNLDLAALGVEQDPAEKIQSDRILFDNGTWNEAHLWMASASVVAHTHYDPYWNVFVQVEGHKTMELISPEYHEHLRMFPVLHPAYRQSQIIVAQGNMDTHLPNQVVVHRVRLAPGDVLFLPPYWFHRVQSHSPSLSVNLWSLSDTYKLVDRTRIHPLPFDETWDLAQRAAGLSSFLHAMLLHLRPLDPNHGSMTAQQLIRHTIDVRYAPLAVEWPVNTGDCTRAPHHSVQAIDQEKLTAMASNLAHLFAAIPEDVRGIALMDWVEETALWVAAGDVSILRTQAFCTLLRGV